MSKKFVFIAALNRARFDVTFPSVILGSEEVENLHVPLGLNFLTGKRLVNWVLYPSRIIWLLLMFLFRSYV